MNNCSYFIKDKALFGSFPTQESVDELEREGVRYFVDLTDNLNETKITPYKTQYTYINFPIKDHYVPTNWVAFAQFILKIAKIIKNLKNIEKVYINCRAGHGRSGVVVACLLCLIFDLTPQQALDYTTKCHSNRAVMKEKWRKIGSPQTFLQKKFVNKFFEPLKIYHLNKNSILLGFSNISNHPVTIEDKKFENSEQAIKYQFEKNLENNKISVIKDILKAKFDQNKDIHKNIINTGLRPFVYHSNKNIKNDKNILGKILTNIRNEYYENIN
jgi:predicted NAD-dependent protein-ADP-ribosyltransferase YbiA (DUF1768 family)